MQIGKLAMLTGVSIRMLRYYESAGLLHPARTDAGYRSFTPDDVDIVRRILILNGAGFTLPVVRRLLNCIQSGTEPCEELKIKVREQLAQIDRQFESLSESRKLLNQLIIG
ncbi:TPA: MerR family transcriptional regulator [Salmonella enterica subsp. enterica serovar Liverpool]|uniref:MerR family transcriptional regulator n=2 Tax=Salmonella enterica TaxID=28901 RepID=UPI00069ADAB0|nr:MerR family transcriptional regulator [Salmonella enterica]EAW1936927.1 MerR family transcriptional regulator [Salmonella enterica subsp. enterica]EBI0293129.1 MerR family transcriptional regulator [Salmonella enterica subsp. enterica serovar Saintpaul]EEC6783742.1 MerR family transcriptional regulator [Salmonella enterica subsp. enterica serovar Olten]EHG1541316.1 MerR family transcriptional regulator [Salmonella enterica subsp. enterica serovar Duisburg]EAA6444366.1 MerR family transcript